jgi:SAM-dependent methyltransferase
MFARLSFRKRNMRSYYTDWHAQHYNKRWSTFTRKTLAETLAMVDMAALRDVKTRLGRSPRVLDVACGTGVLLKQLIERVPDVEAYGVDASADMLAQARVALDGQPNVHLAQAVVKAGETAGLPFAPGSFDLITFTNALQEIAEPVAVLAGLRQLLAPEGQLVIEDYARREPPFPWAIVAWLTKRIDPAYVRAYMLDEAQFLCTQAGLRVTCKKAFTVDWLWHGWALRAVWSSELSP